MHADTTPKIENKNKLNTDDLEIQELTKAAESVKAGVIKTNTMKLLPKEEIGCERATD